MTHARENQPIPDPASQQSGEPDTSIIPDLEADPVEAERAKTDGVDADDA